MILRNLSRVDAQFLAGPYRLPSWRNVEALQVVEEGRAMSPRLHDAVTTALVEFYQHRRLCQNDVDRCVLQKSAPHAMEAVELVELGCPGPRCTVEALVLADESPDRIASRVGVSAEAIGLVEQGFFDVRSRLGRADFIMHHVITFEDAGRDPRRFLCAVRKFFAYTAGVESVEVFDLGCDAHRQWRTVRELIFALGRRARALVQVGAARDGRFADPRVEREVLATIESIEAWDGPWGDEKAPKNRDERDAARLLERMGGLGGWAQLAEDGWT
jgi:hypothetical protein